jgi:nucleoid DNA-binding protein
MRVNRSHIVAALSEERGLSPEAAARAVRAFLLTIQQGLVSGDQVRIRNFGGFAVVAGARRKSVRFRPARRLKGLVDTDPCEILDPLLLSQLMQSFESALSVEGALSAHAAWLESGAPPGARPAEMAGADLKGVDLFGANLKFANLAGANMASADLSDADLESADLKRADLTRASLAWANLKSANLSGACLREVDLRWADLSRADLSNADLMGANLSGADLNNAICAGTAFAGARLKNTILEKRGAAAPGRIERFKRRIGL